MQTRPCICVCMHAPLVFTFGMHVHSCVLLPITYVTSGCVFYVNLSFLLTFDLGVAADDDQRLCGRMQKLPDLSLPENCLTSPRVKLSLFFSRTSFFQLYIFLSQPCLLMCVLFHLLVAILVFRVFGVICFRPTISHQAEITDYILLSYSVSFSSQGHLSLNHPVCSSLSRSCVQHCESSNHFLALSVFFFSPPSPSWPSSCSALLCTPVSPTGMCCLYINITRALIRTCLHKDSFLTSNTIVSGELWRKEDKISH